MGGIAGQVNCRGGDKKRRPPVASASLRSSLVIRLGPEPQYFTADFQSIINDGFLSPPISPCDNFFILQPLQLPFVYKGKKII